MEPLFEPIEVAYLVIPERIHRNIGRHLTILAAQTS